MIAWPGKKRGKITFYKTVISVVHPHTHLSSKVVRAPIPNRSLMEKLGRKRSSKTFLGIEATSICCCRITQADPFENNFNKEIGSLQWASENSCYCNCMPSPKFPVLYYKLGYAKQLLKNANLEKIRYQALCSSFLTYKLYKLYKVL